MIAGDMATPADLHVSELDKKEEEESHGTVEFLGYAHYETNAGFGGALLIDSQNASNKIKLYLML